MTHGRHRLFAAKRRDGWMTYMRGPLMYSQWRGRLPLVGTTEEAGWLHGTAITRFLITPTGSTMEMGR